MSRPLKYGKRIELRVDRRGHDEPELLRVGTRLSERDSLRIIDLLENPPAAPECLVRAAKAGFTLP
jgi:hypothetical protein